MTDVARRHGLATHLDGARLLNAVVASGISAREYAAPFDSAWIDFTKGLGAPVGAALAGSREFIDEAWRCKQQMGGAMRQAGIIAAGGVYALATTSSASPRTTPMPGGSPRGWPSCPGVALDPATVETNIVFFDLTGALDAPTLRRAAAGARRPRWARWARARSAPSPTSTSSARADRAPLQAARAVLAG